MVRQWCAVALGTAALLLVTGLSFAAGHGGGGHGGGGHAGGGHAGGGHAGGMAHGGGGFHSGGFHSGVAHGGFHNGHFHNGHFHNGHFHNGSNFFFGVGLGGWGWGWGGWGWGWGYPWGYGGYYGAYYPGSYDGWYTGDYTVPVSAQNAYGSVPAASTYSSPATVPVALTFPPADNVIYVDIRVPADAEVWVEDQRMSQRGAVRYFESPPVTPSVEYVYHVRARWKEQGQDVDEVREATVHAGSKVANDFTRRTREKLPQPTPKPKVGV